MAKLSQQIFRQFLLPPENGALASRVAGRQSCALGRATITLSIRDK